MSSVRGNASERRRIAALSILVFAWLSTAFFGPSVPLGPAPSGRALAGWDAVGRDESSLRGFTARTRLQAGLPVPWLDLFVSARWSEWAPEHVWLEGWSGVRFGAVHPVALALALACAVVLAAALRRAQRRLFDMKSDRLLRVVLVLSATFILAAELMSRGRVMGCPNLAMFAWRSTTFGIVLLVDRILLPAAQRRAGQEPAWFEAPLAAAVGVALSLAWIAIETPLQWALFGLALLVALLEPLFRITDAGARRRTWRLVAIAAVLTLQVGADFANPRDRSINEARATALGEGFEVIAVTVVLAVGGAVVDRLRYRPWVEHSLGSEPSASRPSRNSGRGPRR